MRHTWNESCYTCHSWRWDPAGVGRAPDPTRLLFLSEDGRARQRRRRKTMCRRKPALAWHGRKPSSSKGRRPRARAVRGKEGLSPSPFSERARHPGFWLLASRTGRQMSVVLSPQSAAAYCIRKLIRILITSKKSHSGASRLLMPFPN